MALKGVLNTQPGIQAKTVAIAPSQSLLDLNDIDSSGLDDGAVMIYDLSSQKFVITQTMDNQNTKIIGGSF